MSPRLEDARPAVTADTAVPLDEHQPVVYAENIAVSESDPTDLKTYIDDSNSSSVLPADAAAGSIPIKRSAANGGGWIARTFDQLSNFIGRAQLQDNAVGRDEKEPGRRGVRNRPVPKAILPTWFLAVIGVIMAVGVTVTLANKALGHGDAAWIMEKQPWCCGP